MDVHPTAHVADGAVLGDGCTVGAFTVIEANVRLGAGSTIGSHCLVGHTEPGRDERELVLGDHTHIRSHCVVYGGSTFGAQLETGHHVTIREGMTVGENLRVGTFSDLQGAMTIGNHVRLHSTVHLSQGSVIGDYVWIFPFTCTTNDPHPPSDGMHTGVTIDDHAVIATGSILLPGIHVGAHAVVGAGALVTRDVESGRVVAGVPGKDRGPASAIELTDGSGPAYPWTRHFDRGYPEDVVADWRQAR